MASIKPIFEDATRTSQIFPITHMRAVIDDDGYNAHDKFGAIMNLINQKQMAIGAVPSDIKPMIGSDHWVTSDGLFKSMYVEHTEIDFSEVTENAYWIRDSDRTWRSSTAVHCILIPVEGNTNYLIIPESGKSTRFSFLRSSNYSNGGTPTFCDGYSESDTSTNTILEVTSPVGAKYLYIIQQTSNPTYTWPSHLYKVSSLKDAYNAVFDVQTSTTRTEAPVSSGFLNSSKTRIRILYNCGHHGRVTAKYTAPNNMNTVQVILMNSYSTSTGSITDANVIKGINLTKGQDGVIEWNDGSAKYVLINAFTGDTMTDQILSDFTAGLTITIEDLVGENGLEERVSKLEQDEQRTIEFLNDALFGTNVKSKGAFGDGQNDDTTALQSALNVGGVVYVPNGTYLISSSLKIYSNTHLIMDKNATILRNSNNIKCLIYTYWEATTTEYNGQHDITIEGGILDMGTGYSQGCCGLGFLHCNNITIRDVTIKHQNSGYHCIDCGGSKNVRVENCLFTDCITSDTSAEMFQFDSPTGSAAFPVINYPDDSACYDNTPCVNVEICGCRFYTNDYSPAIGGHNRGPHSRINIHDNFIYGTGHSRVRGAIAFGDVAWYGGDFIYIHDNFIDNFYNGFQLPPDRNIWIKNNIFSNVQNLLNSDSEGHGTFDNNYSVTTT